jgi:FAD synthase
MYSLVGTDFLFGKRVRVQVKIGGREAEQCSFDVTKLPREKQLNW